MRCGFGKIFGVILLVAFTWWWTAAADEPVVNSGRPAAAAATAPTPGGSGAQFDSANANSRDDGGHQFHFRHHGRGEIWFPISVFAFVLILILGSRYLREKTNQRRLEVVKLMVEKGQPITDAVVQELLVDRRHCGPRGFYGRRGFYRHRHLRVGIIMTCIGAALLLNSYWYHMHPHGHLAGLILLALGVGNLIAYAVAGRDDDQTNAGPKSDL